MHRSSTSHVACFALIIALAFALAVFGQTRADLLLRGGQSSQQAQLQQVYNSQIPSVLKSSAPLPVTILGDHDMLLYITHGQNYQASDADDDDTIDGIYEDRPSRITLRGSTDSTDLPYTFAHEYGHYVWQTFMTKADRSRYARIYKHQLKAHHLVTDYAATDLDEGFAEAFSFYIVNKPELNRRDDQSCQFLDDLLAKMTAAHKSNQPG